MYAVAVSNTSVHKHSALYAVAVFIMAGNDMV